jgi:deoxyguanosine kinase
MTMRKRVTDFTQYKKAPKYIAIEGPMGAGKTTLTNLLAESFGYEAFLEKPHENPFLADFYENPSQAALGTQLFFLFQRIKQIQEIKQGDIFTPTHVSDFLLDKDRLFAKATLNDQELKLYEQIYDYMSLDLPTPDLVIYLQAKTEILHERIMHRGIQMERKVSYEYLELLNESYKNFFFEYERSPVLIVNSEYLDLESNIDDYNLLLEKMLNYFNNPEGVKMYFNPSPSLI